MIEAFFKDHEGVLVKFVVDTEDTNQAIQTVKEECAPHIFSAVLAVVPNYAQIHQNTTPEPC